MCLNYTCTEILIFFSFLLIYLHTCECAEILTQLINPDKFCRKKENKSQKNSGSYSSIRETNLIYFCLRESPPSLPRFLENGSTKIDETFRAVLQSDRSTYNKSSSPIDRTVQGKRGENFKFCSKAYFREKCEESCILSIFQAKYRFFSDFGK